MGSHPSKAQKGGDLYVNNNSYFKETRNQQQKERLETESEDDERTVLQQNRCREIARQIKEYIKLKVTAITDIRAFGDYYVVNSRIAKGAQGTVYRVQRRADRKIFAAKLIKTYSPQYQCSSVVFLNICGLLIPLKQQARIPGLGKIFNERLSIMRVSITDTLFV